MRPPLPWPFWTKAGGAFVAGAVIVAIVPRLAAGGDTPPIGLLLLVGLLVSIVTTGLLYVGLRTDLGLPASASLYAVAYNALVVLVKFVLGPAAVYTGSRRGLEGFVSIDRPLGAAVTATLVLLLYAAGLGLTYAFAKRRWGSPGGRRRERSLRTGAAVVFGIGIAGLALGYPLLVGAFLGLGYLAYVFSSGFGVLMGIALAGAVALAGLTFREAADREALVVATAAIASVFWAGLAFLAIYHVLWVVYVLVLTSIWPLRVVTPK